jgi:hypothetical protein
MAQVSRVLNDGAAAAFETDHHAQARGAGYAGGKAMTRAIYCSSSDTGWPDENLDSVQRALAAYQGNDIWADVITPLKDYDAAATALLQPVCAVPVFVVNTTGYQWCSELGVWQAFDAAREIGESITDPLVMGIASALGRRPRRRGCDTARFRPRPVKGLLRWATAMNRSQGR